MSNKDASSPEGDEPLDSEQLRSVDFQAAPQPSRSAKIDAWQSQTEHSASCLEPADRSLPARLCAGILRLFREITHQTAKRNAAPKLISVGLERACGLITLWSNGYGIQEGNLDSVLAKSRSLRRSALRILSSIANTLIKRLVPQTGVTSDKLDELTVRLAATNAEASYAIHSTDRVSDSSWSSDGSYDDFETDSLKEVLEDLKIDAQCLMDLDPLFMNPALDLPVAKQTAAQTVDWAPEKAYCEKVRQRFPRASELLVSQLGEANWARYLRLQSQRNTTEEPAQHGDQELESGTIAASKFHDSGIGTSLPAESSYAETVMTYTAWAGGSKIRIPPLPEAAKRGDPFDCVACGRSIRAKNSSAWKSHLMSDLKPYVCLEANCYQLGFDTRKDWVSHLALDHQYPRTSESVTCPLCREQLHDGRLAITSHLARHLEEISLSALPINLDEADEDEGTTSKSVASSTSSNHPRFSVGERVVVSESVRIVAKRRHQQAKGWEYQLIYPGSRRHAVIDGRDWVDEDQLEKQKHTTAPSDAELERGPKSDSIGTDPRPRLEEILQGLLPPGASTGSTERRCDRVEGELPELDSTYL
ncbi:hypothetical protein B0T16DRAFT_460662 [Cercophora newfieldiana]|uniref:Oxidoreductase acuF-like C2H2 type zinc-finger domain-containing protein n=1 Tax=Cercophora newfieldiana TaxID=92897 RepID=A0AA40CPL8_9PEZI|nr:hypothetical protein B0T16DRAFT_460662 [Cercophora newfieldiana]